MPSSLAAQNVAQHLLLSLLPVVAFLFGLCLLDSYRLVRPGAVVVSVGLGVVMALAALAILRTVAAAGGWTQYRYSSLGGPAVEETLKFGYMAALIASKRAGFMIDAAIHGVAVGAGFAIVENVLFLSGADASLAVSAFRGFGTAIMHGGTAALAGIVAMRFAEVRGAGSGAGLLIGFATALSIHVLYNQAIAFPAAAAAGAMIVLPITIILFFREGQVAIRRWLGVGFDTDAELLEMVSGGQIGGSRIGTYLCSMRERYPAAIVADMFCLLRLRIELSIRAKGILIMRQAGFEPPRDPELGEKFGEIRHLEKSVGTAGLLAMQPLLRWRDKDLWEINMLTRRRT